MVLFAIAWASIAFSSGAGPLAAVWPANALTLAVLVRWARTPRRYGSTLAYFSLVIVAANLVAGKGAPLSLALTLCNVAEVVIAARLLRGATDPIASLRAFMRFLLGAVLAAPLVSGLGAAAICTVLLPGTSFLTLFTLWFMANSLGMAIVGSLLLTVGRPRVMAPPPGELWRFLAAQAVLVAACVPILVLSDRPLLGLIFPLVIVSAMSHRQLGAVTGVAIFTVFAVLGSVTGRGVAGIAAMAGFEPLIITQLVVASMAFTVLPISALLQRLEAYGAELEERRAKAEELNQIKTRLLAQVSHEIRSPMAGVTTLAELMRDGQLGDLTPDQRETMAQIIASGTQVTDLARDLTDAAVLQSGNATVQVSEVKVDDAIQSAVDVARFRNAQLKGIVEITPGEGGALAVAADPLRLRQILVNLLINGAKYGGHPYLVTIGARLIEGGMIRFEVSDNGQGISADRRERLFRDFERLGAEKTDLDGAGLGLALSQQIATLQNGRLGVEDGDLGGARFWLDLPVWRSDSPAV